MANKLLSTNFEQFLTLFFYAMTKRAVLLHLRLIKFVEKNLPQLEF